jgi:hypothetical protein
VRDGNGQAGAEGSRIDQRLSQLAPESLGGSRDLCDLSREGAEDERGSDERGAEERRTDGRSEAVAGSMLVQGNA